MEAFYAMDKLHDILQIFGTIGFLAMKTYRLIELHKILLDKVI